MERFEEERPDIYSVNSTFWDIHCFVVDGEIDVDMDNDMMHVKGTLETGSNIHLLVLEFL